MSDALLAGSIGRDPSSTGDCRAMGSFFNCGGLYVSNDVPAGSKPGASAVANDAFGGDFSVAWPASKRAVGQQGLDAIRPCLYHRTFRWLSVGRLCWLIHRWGGHSVAAAAVFLDRDGVLNRTNVVDGVPKPPRTIDDFALLPGVEEACAALRGYGFLLIVVTNQPDIARGAQTVDVVERMHGELRRRLPVDDIYMCPHDDHHNCACRKPKPGMLVEAAAVHGIDLARSIMVGDRDKDVEAGRAAGCRTVFVDGGYGKRPVPEANLTVRSLREAVPWIISQVKAGD
jgi:D-glycero-D-manno-heptose 1,7-bisphosphate phosphatase